MTEPERNEVSNVPCNPPANAAAFGQRSESQVVEWLVVFEAIFVELAPRCAVFGLGTETFDSEHSDAAAGNA
jgi:hypothetical protein